MFLPIELHNGFTKGASGMMCSQFHIRPCLDCNSPKWVKFPVIECEISSKLMQHASEFARPRTIFPIRKSFGTYVRIMIRELPFCWNRLQRKKGVYLFLAFFRSVCVTRVWQSGETTLLIVPRYRRGSQAVKPDYDFYARFVWKIRHRDMILR